MNIIIPLAGKDPRFAQYAQPKPLIDIGGEPLIKRCTDSLPWLFDKKNRVIFLCLREDEDRHAISTQLKRLYGAHCEVIIVEQPTEGAACTVLLAKEYINNDDELVIYLADIYFEGLIKEELSLARRKGLAGVIPCFESSNPKYSYAIIDDRGLATRVAEKTVISTHASAGFYYFCYGKDFVWAAEEMIRKDLRVNNAFYICPVYQQLIERGDKVRVAPVRFRFGLGSPEEITTFEKGLVKKNFRIFAHRGIFTTHIENTLPAFQEALDKGFSLELDIQPSKDGELVISHDTHLQRLYGVPLAVRMTQFNELRRKSNGHLATFEELCALFTEHAAKEAEMAIHLKAPANFATAKRVIATVIKHKLLRQTFIFDITEELAKKVKAHRPDALTAASVSDKKINDHLYTIEEINSSPYFDIWWLDEWEHLYTKEFLKRARAKRCYAISPELHAAEHHPHAKNPEKVWKDLITGGVNGICTDEPERLKALLERTQ